MIARFVSVVQFGVHWATTYLYQSHRLLMYKGDLVLCQNRDFDLLLYF